MASSALEVDSIARRPTLAHPKFFYFDLGNVLLNFDHHLAARQMAEVAGVSEQLVWDTVFASDLELRYEAGELDDRAFYEAFCGSTASRPDFDALLLAGSAIFTPNTSIFPIVGALIGAVSTGHSFQHLSRPLVVLPRPSLFLAAQGLRCVCAEL